MLTMQKSDRQQERTIVSGCMNVARVCPAQPAGRTEIKAVPPAILASEIVRRGKDGRPRVLQPDAPPVAPPMPATGRNRILACGVDAGRCCTWTSSPSVAVICTGMCEHDLGRDRGEAGACAVRSERADVGEGVEPGVLVSRRTVSILRESGCRGVTEPSNPSEMLA